ncbi:hypothetical protein PR048_030284 [Dryococelus australis]|uniref:Dynein heavy chain tail domain-containing protein n=1 Tax=Dryococelus australis TaxID=614101 RepID=A0ABQ9G8J3_9NEOP|nr:hypothetical protein PR048_030284 [Dryococelus australis]
MPPFEEPEFRPRPYLGSCWPWLELEPVSHPQPETSSPAVTVTPPQVDQRKDVQNTCTLHLASWKIIRVQLLPKVTPKPRVGPSPVNCIPTHRPTWPLRLAPIPLAGSSTPPSSLLINPPHYSYPGIAGILYLGSEEVRSPWTGNYHDEDPDQAAESDEEKDTDTYLISNEVHFTNPKMSSLVCTKRGAVVEADKSINSQVRLINFSEGSPYETLHAFVSRAIAPYFKSYVKESGRADRDGDKMAPSVEKKMAELEMGLLHLQQNIDIPEISLPVHLIVAAVIKRCADEGRKPKVADLGDKVEDSTFLNQLQNGVNRWIKEIQKVTKLDRDPSSGTALQEISFWLNLERALHRIQEKRESIEVALTLDILKHGKRFHATVSFDTDTGKDVL